MKQLNCNLMSNVLIAAACSAECIVRRKSEPDRQRRSVGGVFQRDNRLSTRCFVSRPGKHHLYCLLPLLVSHCCCCCCSCLKTNQLLASAVGLCALSKLFLRPVTASLVRHRPVQANIRSAMCTIASRGKLACYHLSAIHLRSPHSACRCSLSPQSSRVAYLYLRRILLA